MALTRKLLEGMGIEDKQIETIIEAHTDTVNGLKAERDKYKEQAAKVPDLQKKLGDAGDAANEAEDWKQKYETEHQALKDFRAQIDGEKATAAKDKAYRGMLSEAGIDPKRIDAIMRVTDLSKVEVEDGKLKDSDKHAESAKKEWADFILKTKKVGANPENPPKNVGGVEGADPEIARRIQERHDRKYGKASEEE